MVRFLSLPDLVHLHWLFHLKDQRYFTNNQPNQCIHFVRFILSNSYCIIGAMPKGLQIAEAVFNLSLQMNDIQNGAISTFPSLYAVIKSFVERILKRPYTPIWLAALVLRKSSK